MPAKKVELGRFLFYEKRLSINGQYACSTCHQEEKAFSDGLRRAIGANGEQHFRNSMSSMIVAYNASLSWASSFVRTLEEQIKTPLFNQNPVEIGLVGREALVIELLGKDERYRKLFAVAFPKEELVSIDNMINTIATFVRTLIFGDSIDDRLVYKDERREMSESAWRGMRLFYSEITNFAQFHQGFNFFAAVNYQGAHSVEAGFYNTGFYNVDGKGGYPSYDQGLYEEAAKKNDIGKFRAPSLRNIEYTAPYTHDGSIQTLAAVIDHYAQGGSLPNLEQDSLITGFEISDLEKQDLINFLLSLSDKSYLSEPRFSDPWIDP